MFRKISLKAVHFWLHNKQTKTGLAWLACPVSAYGQKMCPEAGMVSFVCMQFHASITTRRLGLLNFKNPTLVKWHPLIVVVATYMPLNLHNFSVKNNLEILFQFQNSSCLIPLEVHHIGIIGSSKNPAKSDFLKMEIKVLLNAFHFIKQVLCHKLGFHFSKALFPSSISN